MLLLATACARVLDGFSTPESALHDPRADLYLLTNIAGHAVDDVGWIARVSPTGEVVDPRWIDAADADITLDKPKGMAFDDDGVLYVAVGAWIRRFDRETGAPLGDWPIPEADDLNDLLWTGTHLLVTDMGTGSLVEVTRAGDWIRHDVGGKPNGVVLCDGTVTVADWDGHLATWDGATLTHRATLGAARLDGLVCDDGGLLVASWDAAAVVRWGPAGESTFFHAEKPADIGFDASRSRVLVPEFDAGRLSIVPQ